MSSVFLVYPREYAAQALVTRSALRRRGHCVAMDLFNIGGGNWLEQVERGIRRSDDVVVLYGEQALQSVAVADEIDIAIKYKKRLIPVLVDDPESPNSGWPKTLLANGGCHYDPLDSSNTARRIAKFLHWRPCLLQALLVVAFASIAILWIRLDPPPSPPPLPQATPGKLKIVFNGSINRDLSIKPLEKKLAELKFQVQPSDRSTVPTANQVIYFRATDHQLASNVQALVSAHLREVDCKRKQEPGLMLTTRAGVGPGDIDVSIYDNCR